MGVPTGGGTNLGQATGNIIINTASVTAAQKTVQQASQSMTASFNQIGAAVGITFGAAAIAQVGRFALEADKIATAYARQSVAALNLAGSQGKLNELLEVYNKATGGAIDKATALADVTRLQAVGFADSAEELERFARAARGISVATGQNQDYVISQLQLAIANQSTLRLDQLGLGVAEVKARIDELKSANKGLTEEMAYQQAILDLAGEKFGTLVDSVEAQATGVEKLSKAWKDFRLEFGQGAGGGVNIIFEQWADDINRARQELEWFANLMEQVQRAGQQFRFDTGLSDFRPLPASGSVSDRARGNIASTAAAATPARFTGEQEALIRDWARDVADIERQANADRLDATRQYEESRTNTIREYEKTIVRDAEDFGRARARAEEDHAKSIADVRTNAARNETRQAQDFARSLADTRSDSSERVADAREDANKRLAELEEDYHRNRERALAKHNDTLLDAAGRLDAEAVYKEQRNFAQQQKDAEDAHEEQRDDLQEQLQERLDDEAEALEESIRERQEAYDRQLQDAREADEERIRDMEADFELRKEREDKDRAIRLDRLATDHNDQLNEQARAHSLRLQQITEHAAEERTQLDADFRIALNDLDIRTDAWITRQKRITDAAIEEFDRWWDNLIENSTTLQGPPNRIPLPSFRTPASTYNPVPNWQNSGRSSSSTGPVTINIYPTPEQSEERIAQLVEENLIELMERGAN